MRTNPERGGRRFRAPWVIFWVAFGLRVVCILVGHTYRVNPGAGHFYFGFEAGRIARSLVQGHGYGNPFNGISGPTAWLPPLFPLLMAAGFKMFGVYTNGAALFVLVCNSLFSAAVVPAVYEIAARCFDAHGFARRGAKHAEPVALWSAWLWAVYPAALQYAVHWLWETALSTMLFAWAVVLALRLRERRGSLGLWGWFGLLWGLVGLSNASLLLCLPAMVIWIVWPELRALRITARTVGGVVLTTAVFVLVMTPWVVRNELVLHAFVPTRSNLGAELYNSTLERNDGLPWSTVIPLWTGDPEYKQYVAMGEVAYAKMRGEQGKARIVAKPLQIARWTVDRFFFFWDGTPHPPDRHPAQEFLRELSYSFLSLCGLLGLGLMVRQRVQGAGLFLVAFVLVPLPYYLVIVQPRFRHPLEPLIAVLGVFLFRSAETRGR
jgi:hypothetical protein